MKIFTFGRVAHLAMLGGAIYYVRKHGGLKATWNHLAEQIKPAKPTQPHPAYSVDQPLGGSGMPDFDDKSRY